MIPHVGQSVRCNLLSKHKLVIILIHVPTKRSQTVVGLINIAIRTIDHQMTFPCHVYRDVAQNSLCHIYPAWVLILFLKLYIVRVSKEFYLLNTHILSFQRMCKTQSRAQWKEYREFGGCQIVTPSKSKYNYSCVEENVKLIRPVFFIYKVNIGKVKHRSTYCNSNYLPKLQINNLFMQVCNVVDGTIGWK